jgi:hypothetical protein
LGLEIVGVESALVQESDLSLGSSESTVLALEGWKRSEFGARNKVHIHFVFRRELTDKYSNVLYVS